MAVREAGGVWTSMASDTASSLTDGYIAFLRKIGEELRNLNILNVLICLICEMSRVWDNFLPSCISLVIQEKHNGGAKESDTAKEKDGP